MNVNEILLSKNGYATLKLSKEFIKYCVGDRIPTVTELSTNLNLSRGTAQNALKTLQDNHVIQIRSKGHLGSFLIDKDMKLLLEFAGISSIVGAMPLPYSKRYEGLASGLIAAMKNKYGIPVSMAYMRGADSRLKMVDRQRYDFAIISRFAAEEYLKEHESIEITVSFGKDSYLNSHAIMFNDFQTTEIKDHMRVGIDYSSIDQRVLTRRVCEGKDVIYIPVEYTNIIERIFSGEIDAAVMNLDEVKEKHLKINYVALEEKDSINTEAVLVTNSQAKQISVLLREVIDPQMVLDIQKKVMEGVMVPNY